MLVKADSFPCPFSLGVPSGMPPPSIADLLSSSSPCGSHMSTLGVDRAPWRSLLTQRCTCQVCCPWMHLTPPKLRVPGVSGLFARIRRQALFPILGNNLWWPKDLEKIRFSLECLKLSFPQLCQLLNSTSNSGTGEFSSLHHLPFSGLFPYHTPFSSHLRASFCGQGWTWRNGGEAEGHGG